MSTSTCPFCGAAFNQSTPDGEDVRYQCGTWVNAPGPLKPMRANRCLKSEVARLTRERDEALDVLEKWLRMHARQYIPGAWDYSKRGAALCEEAAKLLGISDPWEQPMPPRAKAKEAQL